MTIDEKAQRRIEQLNITEEHRAMDFKAGYMYGYADGCVEAIGQITKYLRDSIAYGHATFPDAEARPFTKAETR